MQEGGTDRLLQRSGEKSHSIKKNWKFLHEEGMTRGKTSKMGKILEMQQYGGGD